MPLNEDIESSPMTLLKSFPNKVWFFIKKYPKRILASIGILLTIALCFSISNQLFFALLGIHEEQTSLWDFLRYAPDVWEDPSLARTWIIALCIPWIVIAILIGFVLKESKRFLFGKAHWASFGEAKKAGLLAQDGLLIGRKWGQYLKVSGYEHVFVFSPSGSGKTTSLVIPNLLNWDGSCVVTDVKMTLFETTALFRQKHGQQCFLWNPGTRDGKTHAYNPLDWISQDKALRIDDLQKIALTFIPDKPNTDPIWTAEPRVLFVALALYLIDTPSENASIGAIIRLVKNTPNFSSWVYKVLQERQDLDPLCYRNFNSFLQTDYRLQTNILKSFTSHFELFDNPYIDAATRHSDFDMTRLRKERMTVYVGVTSDNLVRLSPLLTVFYQQVLSALLQKIPDSIEEPHGVLLLMDEFSALKRMEILEKSIGLLREYRVRMMIFIQDLPQIYTTYGHDGGKAFINNKVRIAFAQNDLDAAKLISGWLGNKTVQQYTKNERSMGFDSKLGSSQSMSYTKRELMTPNEIMQLPYEKEIIVMEGNPPVLANKNFWFNDVNLKGRVITGQVDIPTLQPTIVPFDRALLKELKDPMEPNKSSRQVADDA